MNVSAQNWALFFLSPNFEDVEQIDIKDISGAILLTTLPNEGCKRKFTLMKEDYITLKFSLESPIFFKLGSCVECDFGLFEVCDLQKPVFNTDNAGYDYELQLDAHYWKWKNKVFKYTPETAGQEASWNLTASLDVQAGIVLRNLKALGYKYKGQDFEFSIDSTVENKAQLMSYDNINILDACFEMAKKWDCECWVTDNIIHFGRCEFGTAVDFEIAKNVDEMTRSESQSTYATRIYAFGSTRNIPANYRPVDESVVVNGVVQKRLMLPEGIPYIDAYPNMTTEEAIEQVVVFDEVYPRRVGTMSDITTHEYTDKIENEDGTTTEEKWNAYRFKDTGITFSKDYVLPGEELKITFQSGKLNGMIFAVTFDPDGKDEQLWEIVRNEDYGRKLPGDLLVPQNGDTYVLSGWDSTNITEMGLVAEAQLELKDKAEKHVAKSKIDPNTYSCKMVSDDAYREDGIHHLYGIGQKVNLINKAYFENGRQSRVIGFEFNLDKPYDSPVYTVGETAAYSRIGELEEKIENITLAGQTYTSGGGSGVYLIRRNDSTPATDSNTFSALRSLAMFLRKDQPDQTEFLIKFLAGLECGDFEQGSTGVGVYKDEAGNWHIETDYLDVRMKFTAKEVEIQKVFHIGGAEIKSSASMKCVRVEELEDAYRCYMNTADNDGQVIYNRFKVNDQAYVQTFNLERQADGTLGNHFFWRLVTAVGDDYIDLSKSVAALASDAPKAFDDIVQLGYRGTDDPSRQVAVIDAGAGEGAPYYRQYVGINSFHLPEPETQLKPGDNKLSGVLHIEKGSTGAANLSDLPGFIQQAQQMGTVNLLRNSGFTGDYETEELAPDTELAPDSEMYSKALEFWTGMTTVQEDAEAVSGRSAVIGSLSQSVALINRELYVVSYKAKGESVDVSCGDFSVSQPLTSDYQRYTHSFTFSGTGVFMLGGTATVCDVQLERGTIATDWKPSPLDNDRSMAEFQALSYIYDVLKNGSVDILGGLILASMIQLGNYKDGKMRKVTAGVSGVYNDDDDVYTWGGGTLEQAIRTVMKYKENPKYQPTPEELKTMANIVLTHGGRAILNDVIVRGYVYALGGYFKGTVEIAGGKILLNEDGSGRLADGTIYWDTYGRMFQKSRSIILWRSMAEEMYEQGVTDRYDVDFHAGTYLNVNNGGPTDGRTINLPAASGTPDMVLDIRANLIGRLAGAYPIGCEADGGIRVYNTDTKAYDTLQAVYFSKEIDSGILEDTIESIEDNDGYHWYAGRLFTGNQ